jgi:uncharacterized protein (TIGR01370 family)
MVMPRAAGPLLCALAALACCSRTLPPAGETRSPLAGVERWWILIGHAQALDVIDWRGVARDTQMVVLSGDPRIPLDSLPHETVRLAYLSVGEADSHGAYWNGVRDSSFLVEANPDWPGNMRVDVRDKRWQDVLLGQEAPRLLGLGFQGFMLDTIDTPPYLESRDSARFAGSRQALRDLVHLLRQTFPNSVVVANGGAALPDVAPFVDGFVVEGVFATYDFRQRVYRATSDAERAWKLGQIEKARAIAPRPVFTIEYADIGDVDLGRWAESESIRHGFHPYVTVKELNAVP